MTIRPLLILQRPHSDPLATVFHSVSVCPNNPDALAFPPAMSRPRHSPTKDRQYQFHREDTSMTWFVFFQYAAKEGRGCCTRQVSIANRVSPRRNPYRPSLYNHTCSARVLKNMSFSLLQLLITRFGALIVLTIISRIYVQSCRDCFCFSWGIEKWRKRNITIYNINFIY